MEDTTVQRVADTVRAEMARRRVTQTSIANDLHISQAALSRRLSGMVPFDVKELSALASLLDMPVSSLLGEVAA